MADTPSPGAEGPPEVKALQDEIRRLREINNRLRSDLYKANRMAEQWQRMAVEFMKKPAPANRAG